MRKAVGVFLAVCGLCGIWGTTEIFSKDFTENGQLVRSETDKDGDGRPDFFCEYANGVKTRCRADSDQDGLVDVWDEFTPQGRLLRKISDTNKDGKPDRFYEFPGGLRQFVWREFDRNGDGKIDRRVYAQWRPDQKMTILLGSRMTQIPNPGYRTIFREDDNDYDGVIDGFYRRGGRLSKIGQPMNTESRTRRLPKTVEGFRRKALDNGAVG